MAQLLSNLPIGAKIKFGKHSINGETALPITWVVVAKNHTGYPSNSVTLLTEKIIDLRAYDAKEPDSAYDDRFHYGNNTYSESNIGQWLDSSEVSWFKPTHSADKAPTAEFTSTNTHYDTRPGFLSNFSAVERLAILSTPLVSSKYSSTTETLYRSVFLPSYTELGFDHTYKDGTSWGYFGSVDTRKCTVTTQCYNNTLCTAKPSAETTMCYWMSRSADYSNTHKIRCVNNLGGGDYYESWSGNCGVRPALNLGGAQKISDTVDSEGCYVPIFNSAPPAPNTIALPTAVYGGKSNVISWSNVADPDGDTVTYQLECSVNGGGYAQVYNGTASSYAHLVPFGTTSVTYRVKASDPSGESSDYTQSGTVSVVNNKAPVISGTDENLGVKSSGFTGTYTISDAENNAVTVTESIDGVQIRSLVATLGQEITYGVTETTWLALANGSHTLTISATDGIDTSVRTYVFTKLVESLKIQNSTPWEASTMPTRIMLVVTRNIPSLATFKVEVCNNGYDTSPKWEDATDAVTSGLVHVFSNKSKTASKWGVLVRVTVNRNGMAGACYISAIGGNFE